MFEGNIASREGRIEPKLLFRLMQIRGVFGNFTAAYLIGGGERGIRTLGKALHPTLA